MNSNTTSPWFSHCSSSWCLCKHYGILGLCQQWYVRNRENYLQIYFHFFFYFYTLFFESWCASWSLIYKFSNKSKSELCREKKELALFWFGSWGRSKAKCCDTWYSFCFLLELPEMSRLSRCVCIYPCLNSYIWKRD